MSGTDWQPGVVEPPGTELHCSVMPGTFPETAVTWKVESVSKEMPQPARITVFWFPNGDQGMPMIWLTVVSRRVLSVLLMPGAFAVATDGVLKPTGARTDESNDRVGVTLIPPGCPR